MNKIQRKFRSIWARNKECLFGYGVMLVTLAVYAAANPNFFSSYAIKSTFDQFLNLTFAALAQTLVILTGGIDLSVGAQIGLTNAVCATIMGPVVEATGGFASGVTLTILITLACGLTIGLLNGALIVYGRLQPIVVTLATSFIFNGLGLFVCPTPGGTVVKGFSKLFIGKFFGFMPKSAVWMMVALFLLWMPIRRSRFGQSIYAIGGGEYASFISGINIKRTKLWVYGLAGLFCAMSGVLLTAATNAGDPTGCEAFTLNAVAAAALGGTSLAGGRGTYVGTIAGVVVYTLMLSLLILFGVDSFYQSAASGLILIAALSITAIQHAISEKRRIRS